MSDFDQIPRSYFAIERMFPARDAQNNDITGTYGIFPWTGPEESLAKIKSFGWGLYRWRREEQSPGAPGSPGEHRVGPWAEIRVTYDPNNPPKRPDGSDIELPQEKVDDMSFYMPPPGTVPPWAAAAGWAPNALPWGQAMVGMPTPGLETKMLQERIRELEKKLEIEQDDAKRRLEAKDEQIVALREQVQRANDAAREADHKLRESQREQAHQAMLATLTSRMDQLRGDMFTIKQEATAKSDPLTGALVTHLLDKDKDKGDGIEADMRRLEMLERFMDRRGGNGSGEEPGAIGSFLQGLGATMGPIVAQKFLGGAPEPHGAPLPLPGPNGAIPQIDGALEPEDEPDEPPARRELVEELDRQLEMIRAKKNPMPAEEWVKSVGQHFTPDGWLELADIAERGELTSFLPYLKACDDRLSDQKALEIIQDPAAVRWLVMVLDAVKRLEKARKTAAAAQPAATTKGR